MRQTHRFPRRIWKTRAISLALALTILLGLAPAIPVQQAQAHWAEPYLNQLVEWGFIRADQADEPNQELTRADFMSITNRAYGYHEPGPTPFTDVDEKDWFYDDVGIAYTARYIKGTSPTTASPGDPLTRETAATILGRNMMLQESAGEILDFTDAREISSWAKGTIKASLEHYLVEGYDDGSFKPQKDLTWGEMAAMLTHIVGTPLQEAGDYSLGGVFGNVTITSPGVTLRDSIISGDLYITGGVGLGDVKLENVTVLGRIIASGTGESESGEASILLRNVVADELLVDNLQDNYVTVRAEGITEIGRTTVRTSAYIEDNTPDGLGLKYISLEGDPPPAEDEEGAEDYVPVQLDLAGRVEEVVNRTPGSQVRAAKGTVAKLTVDEAATDSRVIIDRGAVVTELNLDVGTNVTGQGDVGKLNVNAPGSIVTMLPDQIYIRPGLTAVINGQVMDSTGAEESSLDPMLLSGYPTVTDIAPTSATAVFATNKRGTIHWAVSAITDGSVEEDDLIKPPAYGGIAIQRGTVASPQGDTEVTAPIAGLTADGSYYLSAVLVDERGQRSPTKVISFTTPDNTVPAFNEGYPYMSLIEDTRAQTTVSATKTCVLYYALLPEGAQAPTVNDLRTASVSGNLGYGVRSLTKNVEDSFFVNDLTLEEKKNYVVYFWLTDVNGANSSAVISLPFTTVDKTPPEFIVEPWIVSSGDNNVDLSFRLNENGTFYWAVVPTGADFPRPRPGQSSILLTDEYAKQQVMSGIRALAFGQAAATADTDVPFTVNGLEPETTYDLYYVAQDEAGNTSLTVKRITISTNDNSGPTVIQRFTDFIGDDDTKRPTKKTDLILEFSENVRSTVRDGGDSFWDLWQAYKNASSSTREAAWTRLINSIRGSITLYKQDPESEAPIPMPVVGEVSEGETVTTDDPEWIDFSEGNIEVSMLDGKVQVKFLNRGLHLIPGSRYFFEITNMTDYPAMNPLRPQRLNYTNTAGTNHILNVIEIEFASVILKDISGETATARMGKPYLIERDSTATDVDLAKVKKDAGGRPVYSLTGDTSPVDAIFRLNPSTTDLVDQNICYDIYFFTNQSVSFDLFYRITDKNGNVITQTAGYKDTYANALIPTPDGYGDADPNGWIFLGYSGLLYPPGEGTDSFGGKTLNGQMAGCAGENKVFPPLRNLRSDLQYEFVVTLKMARNSAVREDWVGMETAFRCYVAAGQAGNLARLSNQFTMKNWEDSWDLGLVNGAKSIGQNWKDGALDYLQISMIIPDDTPPYFLKDNPTFDFDPEDSHLLMHVALSRPGTVYYVIGQADTGGGNSAESDWNPEWTTWYYVGNDTYNIGYSAVPRNGTEAQSKASANKPSGNTDPNYIYRTPPINLARPTVNTVRYPAQSEVRNGIYGDIPCDGVKVTNYKEPEELKPDTAYYVYMVIHENTGVSGPSDVFIYRFRTPPETKPKINLATSADGSTVTIRNVASDVDYIIYTETNANKITKLDGYLSANNNLTTGQKLPGCYQNLTIKQALSTDYRYSDAAYYRIRDDAVAVPGYGTDNAETYTGYSVFDIYASDTLKQQVGEWIRTGDSNNGFGENGGTTYVDWHDKSKGSVSLTTTGRLEPNDKIGGTGTYAIFVVARNQRFPNKTLNDGYRALWPLKKVKSGPPELISRGANLTRITGTTGPCKGSITLGFDTELYLRTGSKVDNSNFLPSVYYDDTDPNSGFTTTVTPTGDGTAVIISFKNTDNVQFPISIPIGYYQSAKPVPTTKYLLIDYVTNVQIGESDSGIPLYGAAITIEWAERSNTPGEPTQHFERRNT